MFALKAANQEVYTAFDSKTGVLTYYFDAQREARAAEGKIVEVYDPVSNPDAVRFKDYHDQVTKAVIDKSMLNWVYNESLAKMFYGGYEIQGNYLINYNLSNMTQISGLENIVTFHVTSMHEMFRDCKSLETLDLSSFNTRNLTDMNRMFKNCSSLKSLDVRPLNTANVKYMDGLFAVFLVGIS